MWGGCRLPVLAREGGGGAGDSQRHLSTPEVATGCSEGVEGFWGESLCGSDDGRVDGHVELSDACTQPTVTHHTHHHPGSLPPASPFTHATLTTHTHTPLV